MSDISTTSWSEVDASNNTQPPEGWPAGMAPNQVEPTSRMMMSAMKRWYNHINPVYLAALATTDTFTVTEAQAPAGYSLNQRYATRFPSANTTTSPTVNHSSLGAQLIKKWNNSGSLANLAVGDIQAQIHEYYWDQSEMVLLNPASLTLGTTNKASPTSSDSMVIGDAAAAGVQKEVLLSALSTLPNTYPTKATPTSSDSVVITDAAASGAGKTSTVNSIVRAAQPLLTVLTNTLSGDVALNNAASFFDGPSVAQGTAGTWYASGTIQITGGALGATVDFRLWDGTTLIDSGVNTVAAASAQTFHFSGSLASPAGNLRISAKSNQTDAKISFNASGDSKDSTITAIRIA